MLFRSPLNIYTVFDEVALLTNVIIDSSFAKTFCDFCFIVRKIKMQNLHKMWVCRSDNRHSISIQSSLLRHILYKTDRIVKIKFVRFFFGVFMTYRKCYCEFVILGKIKCFCVVILFIAVHCVIYYAYNKISKSH